VQKVLPAIKEEKNVIICAHRGSMRALVKYIENISDKDLRESASPQVSLQHIAFWMVVW